MLDSLLRSCGKPVDGSPPRCGLGGVAAMGGRSEMDLGVGFQGHGAEKGELDLPTCGSLKLVN